MAGVGSEDSRPALLPVGLVPERWNVKLVFIETPHGTAINWTSLLADSFWRKLEPAGKNTWHCDVLIQFLPAQRKTIHFDFNLLQLLLRGRSQATETVGGKTDKASVMQFDIYCSSFGPRTHSGRFQGNRWFSEDGVHNMLF